MVVVVAGVDGDPLVTTHTDLQLEDPRRRVGRLTHETSATSVASRVITHTIAASLVVDDADPGLTYLILGSRSVYHFIIDNFYQNF